MLIATIPGEFLLEEFLRPDGRSASALAKALRLDAPRINEIVRERRSVSPDTALRLGRYFGTTPDLWLNLQSAHGLSKAKAERAEEIERSEEHTSELQSLMRISYAVFCLKKKKIN